MAVSEYSGAAQSPLERSLSMLESRYGTQLDRLEKRQPHVIPPWWTPPFTQIAESLEVAAKEQDATPPATLCVYTDGSGIDGYVGAAAIALALQLRDVRTKRIE